MTTLRIVVHTEEAPPVLLGTWMPPRPDDEDIVRYYTSDANEEEHFAPYDCVAVITVDVP